MAKFKSIMSDDPTRCYICGKRGWIEFHHVFGGPFRAKSTKYGLVVPLCHSCHNEPPNGVHHNAEKMRWLRAKGQEAFEREYPDKEFIKEFGRNWK